MQRAVTSEGIRDTMSDWLVGSSVRVPIPPPMSRWPSTTAGGEASTKLIGTLPSLVPMAAS